LLNLCLLHLFWRPARADFYGIRVSRNALIREVVARWSRVLDSFPVTIHALANVLIPLRGVFQLSWLLSREEKGVVLGEKAVLLNSRGMRLLASVGLVDIHRIWFFEDVGLTAGASDRFYFEDNCRPVSLLELTQLLTRRSLSAEIFFSKRHPASLSPHLSITCLSTPFPEERYLSDLIRR